MSIKLIIGFLIVGVGFWWWIGVEKEIEDFGGRRVVVLKSIRPTIAREYFE
jgi:hypothetical protein